jgi:hypothetical protein
MTAIERTVHEYTIRSDDGTTTVMAIDIDSAARAWADGAGSRARSAVTGLPSLIEYIESIDGAWLFVQSDTAPDGTRVYAARHNMP